MEGLELQAWYSELEIGEDSAEGLRLRKKMTETMPDTEHLNSIQEAEIPQKF